MYLSFPTSSRSCYGFAPIISGSLVLIGLVLIIPDLFRIMLGLAPIIPGFWIWPNKASFGLTGFPRWTLENLWPMLATGKPTANVVSWESSVQHP